MEQNIITSMPRIGDKAPSFKAISTQGEIKFPDDYAGSWVIFFSHPADFTPVCTTEFIMFASMEEKFNQANCKLVGLSVDGIYSHIAWLRTIKEKIEFKGHKYIDIKFPLIDDSNKFISHKYGMIHSKEDNSHTVRAVFFIDPDAIIRAIIYYPACLGRNFDEIYRVLIALKTADAFRVSTPADWQPGDDIILTTPETYTVAREKLEGNDEAVDCKDWFFCTKKLDKDVIFKKILS
jgi:peroxiredoxin (alkyl hydroperoxide reductase subunit C)